jgi:putative oxidoreductase
MFVAVATVHWRDGFWSSNGGFEYNLLIWAAAIAVAASGPGRFSLDAALGWVDNLSGVWWGVGVLAASLAGGGLVFASRQAPPDEAASDEPLARETADERDRVTV